MVVSSPEKQAEVDQSGPYQTQPRAGGDGRDFVHPRAVGPSPGEGEVTCGRCFFACSFSPFSQSLKTVWQFGFRPLVLKPGHHIQFRLFPKTALSKSVLCQKPSAACGPLRFPESKGCQVPSPLNCSKVRTAIE